MDLKILTPEKVLLEESNISEVNAVAVDGALGVQKHHVPMVTPLKPALLTFTKGGTKKTVAVMGGMFSTDGQTVTVLSEAAEQEADIDFVRAEEAKKRAEARLAEQKENLDVHRAEYALAKALARLQLKR